MNKLLRLSISFLIIFVILFTASCTTIQPVSHDQGKHKGWYKNPNNPHHPDTHKEKLKPKKK